MTTVHASEEWVLVGRSSSQSLLVRGGSRPIAISVSHRDSSDLLDLLKDANLGVKFRENFRENFPVGQTK